MTDTVAAMNVISAAFAEVADAAAVFGRGIQEMIDAVCALHEALRVDRDLTVPGRWMWRLACRFGISEFDALVWMEQFPGAFRGDFEPIL